MATQKGDDTHVLVECADDLFSLHSDRIQPKAQHRRRILSQGALSTKILCAFGVLLVLVTAISMGTLAVSLYALRISEKLGASREWDNEKFLQQEESDRNTLFQVEGMMESSGEMTFSHPHVLNRGVSEIVPEKGSLPSFQHMPNRNALAESDPLPESDHLPESSPLPGYRNQRSVDGANEDLCTSSNETKAKPLAHIVGPKTRTQMKLSNLDRFSVLTEKWECQGSSGGVRAMVQGGIMFHRSSGFLELPVAGVYYVYHQITFRPRGRGPVRLARSRLVACIPDQDCSYIAEDNNPYMQTESELAGRYGNSKFQAGLFWFPAGSQIAILVWNELYNRPHLDAIRYDDYGYNTYMGAYLVDHGNL